jgi:protein subunit release factor B
MKVSVTFDLSESERCALARQVGEERPAAREAIQQWVRKTVQSTLDVLVQEHVAMEGVETDAEIRAADLRIQRFRSPDSRVNQADNAVRIEHLPSRIVVESADAVPWHENRRRAMEQLQERLRLERDGLCPICRYPANSGPCQRSHP